MDAFARRLRHALALRAAISSLLAVSLSATACSEEDEGPPAPARQVTLQVTLDRDAVAISERFLSVAVDAAQVVGGVFWDPAGTPSMVGSVRVLPFDFDRPELRTLASALAPAFLRIGGSAADEVFYDLSATPSATPPPNYAYVLTKAQWDGLARFAEDLDFRPLFTLNAGKGPRVDDGPWQPDNARELVRYAAAQGHPVDIWELGNEINGYPLLLGLNLKPADYARDLQAARTLLAAEHPSAKLAGPAVAFWPKAGDFIGFYEPFMPLGGQHLDVVTWHYYPMQSRRCALATRRATLKTALSLAMLDELASWAEIVEQGAKAYAPQAELWLGETGNAQCGGEPGVSDGFAGSFWWLDQLAQLARRGQRAVVRQTLAGSNYGLLDDVTLEPRPDYWASLLWRRLVGGAALDVAQTTAAGQNGPDTALRAYVQCARGAEGGVVLLALNLSTSEAVRVRLAGLRGRREVYLLDVTTDDDGMPALGSKAVRLSGQPLALAADGSLPQLSPLADGAGQRGVDLPPASIAFVVFPDANAAACR